jgi:signal transduction histidine kinase
VNSTPIPPNAAQPKLASTNPMHSLIWKLLLAFLGVGIAASLLMAGLIGWQTRLEFERFIINRYRNAVVPLLAAYYERNGSWEGADELLALGERGPAPDGQGQGARNFAVLTLVDRSGITLYTVPRGQAVRRLSAIGKLPIVVDGETVGWLFFRFAPVPAGTPEAEFLGRTGRVIFIGLMLATIMALILGLVLARTLSRPLRALIAATRAMAKGALGTQVDIRTKDELGELGSAFNTMSTDLARSLQLRRQMTADIAHDLRTPLSVILGYTEALNDGKFAGDFECLQRGGNGCKHSNPSIYAILHDEAQHLSRLIDDLRMLSLADAGELPLQRNVTPPRELLERAAAAHRVKAEQKGVNLTVAAPSDLPRVEVDPERMQQVLGNLVSNALRYTPAGGEIVLRGEVVDGHVTLRVQDSGSGIESGDLPFIFERFYRGDRARNSNTGESGLGLPIAKSLVEMHKGVITVASQVGQGTTFTIFLPAAS